MLFGVAEIIVGVFCVVVWVLYSFIWSRGGGGGVLPYISRIGVGAAAKGRILTPRFGLKTVIAFVHFGLESEGHQ